MTNILQYRDIERIKTIVNQACEDASREGIGSHEAINWGDLGWVDVGVKNDHYYVLIEEASPTSFEFQRYISDRLMEQGFLVEVRTEW